MPPNIVWILTDQQRFDSLSCYGCRAIETPHLDALAADGWRFDKCYADNPVCTPSRSSMLTGRPLTGHGVYKLHDILPEQARLLPWHLQQRGYRTALFGKLHVSGLMHEQHRRHPCDGFDVYGWCQEPSLFLDAPYNAYSAWLRGANPQLWARLRDKGRGVKNIPKEWHFSTWIGNESARYIAEWQGDAPFFLLASFFDPHNPYDQYPEEYAQGVDMAGLGKPHARRGEAHEKSAGMVRSHENSYLGRYDDFDEERLTAMRTGYYSAVRLIDEQVGRIVDALKAKGVYDNTAIIFTSDHGDMLGDRELLAKGAFFYDPCSRVPLLIKDTKGRPGGVAAGGFAQGRDIFATVLARAGYSPAELAEIAPDSVDLCAAAAAGTLRDVAVCEYRCSGIDDRKLPYDPPIYATMLVKGDFKLCLYHHEDSERCGELYDMAADPLEAVNLWNDARHSRVARDMAVALADELVRRDVIHHGSRGGTAANVNSAVLQS